MAPPPITGGTNSGTPIVLAPTVIKVDPRVVAIQAKIHWDATSTTYKGTYIDALKARWGGVADAAVDAEVTRLSTASPDKSTFGDLARIAAQLDYWAGENDEAFFAEFLDQRVLAIQCTTPACAGDSEVDAMRAQTRLEPVLRQRWTASTQANVGDFEADLGALQTAVQKPEPEEAITVLKAALKTKVTAADAKNRADMYPVLEPKADAPKVVEKQKEEPKSFVLKGAEVNLGFGYGDFQRPFGMSALLVPAYQGWFRPGKTEDDKKTPRVSVPVELGVNTGPTVPQHDAALVHASIADRSTNWQLSAANVGVTLNPFDSFTALSFAIKGGVQADPVLEASWYGLGGMVGLSKQPLSSENVTLTTSLNVLGLFGMLPPFSGKWDVEDKGDHTGVSIFLPVSVGILLGNHKLTLGAAYGYHTIEDKDGKEASSHRVQGSVGAQFIGQKDEKGEVDFYRINLASMAQYLSLPSGVESVIFELSGNYAFYKQFNLGVSLAYADTTRPFTQFAAQDPNQPVNCQDVNPLTCQDPNKNLAQVIDDSSWRLRLTAETMFIDGLKASLGVGPVFPDRNGAGETGWELVGSLGAKF